MASTIEQVLAEMLRRASGDSLGRYEPVTSLTTTTVVCGNTLNTGTVTAQKYINKWLYRPNSTAVADRYRLITNFAAATGTFTHAGANYTDTTATNENVFILEYEPQFYLDAIQVALSRMRRESVLEIPVVTNETRYVIPDITNTDTDVANWIREPSDIDRIVYTSSPVLSRNRYFNEWNGYQTGSVSSVDEPGLDWWYGTGTTAYSRNEQVGSSGGQFRRGIYEVALSAAADNGIAQVVWLPHAGPSSSVWTSKVLTLVVVGRTTTSSCLSGTIASGATTDTSDFATNSGLYEELTAQITLPTTPNSVTITVSAANSGAANLSEAYVFEGDTLNDQIRLDNYQEMELDRSEWECVQTGSGFELMLPRKTRPGVYKVYTRRPYSRFSSTRFAAATIDDVEQTDAPLEIVATGAIGRLYESLAQRPGEDATRYRALAAEWNRRFAQQAMAHTYRPSGRDSSPIPRARSLAAAPVRW